MKSACRIRTLLIYLVIFISLSYATSKAATPEPPLMPSNYVVDLAGIIKDDVEAQIDAYLRELEQKTTAQVVILTIQSLDGEDIEGFSLRMAERWRLGQKGKDNGLLLVIALQDRRYRFEVGYGLEAILPDSLVGSIGRQYLVPYFKKGDYSTGILNGMVEVVRIIANNEGVEIKGMPQIKGRSGKEREFIFHGAVLFFILLIIFLRTFGLFFSNNKRYRRGGWSGFFFGGGGFGGGGFGGGFSGGGGGFGGGGASGRW